jgi:hypothetical protein
MGNSQGGQSIPCHGLHYSAIQYTPKVPPFTSRSPRNPGERNGARLSE